MRLASNRSTTALVLFLVANATVFPAVAQTGAPPAYPPPAPSAPPPAVPPGAPGSPAAASPYGQPPPPPPPYGQPGQPPYGQPPYGQAPYGQPPYMAPAPYPPPGPPPLVHRKRRGLVTAGAITFGVTWGLAATISLLFLDSSDSSCSGSCDSFMSRLWIPVIGPVWAAQADGSWDSGTGPVLWSVAQAAGLTMLIVGMVGHDVPDYPVYRRASLTVTPTLARDSSGLALRGTW